MRIACPPIKHPGLLRHRHAGAEIAACRHPHAWKRCAIIIGVTSLAFLSVDGRLPGGRLRTARSASGRNSPITALPAIIRPISPTSSGNRPSSSCRSLPRPAELHDRRTCQPHRGRHRCVARYRPKYAALGLARKGAHVIALARTQGGLEELDDEIKASGGSATLVPADIKDYPALDRLGAAIHRTLGQTRYPHRQCRHTWASFRPWAISSPRPGTKSWRSM